MLRSKQIAAAASVLGLVAFAAVPQAGATPTTDRPASILVWPKVVVDSSGGLFGQPTETEITIANTYAGGVKQAHCFYVNATSHCSNNPSRACVSAADCNGGDARGDCIPGWSETDFDIYLTHDQPLRWDASAGLYRGDFPIEGPFFCNAPLGSIQCFAQNDPRCGAVGCNLGQNNLGSAIPPVPEDPFIGSLTCIQYTGGSNSVPDQSETANQLVGSATINRGEGSDLARYSANGLIATGTPVSNGTLRLGADGNYGACASTLVLSHLFDGASDPAGPGLAGAPVTTDLTLVPCSSNYSEGSGARSTAQFLVFNEFEQRFSTSRTVDCLLDTPISRIDTRSPSRSIFSTGVAGTIAGQTRIRGVAGSSVAGVETRGGLLGVAVLKTGEGLRSAAYNLHQQGQGSGVDVIAVP